MNQKYAPIGILLILIPIQKTIQEEWKQMPKTTNVSKMNKLGHKNYL